MRHRVVCAALVRDGRVLLGHRSPGRRSYPDVWDLPGGHVDGGETPAAALVREHDELRWVDLAGLDGLPLADPAYRDLLAGWLTGG